MSLDFKFYQNQDSFVEKLDIEFWYAILDQGSTGIQVQVLVVGNMNTVVALASAGISVGLANWGLAWPG